MYELGFLFKKSVDSIHGKMSGIEIIAREYSFEERTLSLCDFKPISKTTIFRFDGQKSVPNHGNHKRFSAAKREQLTVHTSRFGHIMVSNASHVRSKIFNVSFAD